MGWQAAAAAASAIFSYATSRPKTPQLQAPPPAPQASKTPDANAVAGSLAGTGQAGGAPGVAQTFLTGPGGIDPSLLQLGKTTLLGG